MRGRLFAITITTTLALATAGTSQGAATPEQTCEGGKVDTAGRYFACVAKAEKALVSNGDASRYDLSVAKCAVRFTGRWGDLETSAVNAGSMCPSEGDSSDILDFLDFCEQSVAVAVGGGPLPSDCLTCDGDLAACDADLATTEGDFAACVSDLGTCNSSLSSALTNLTLCSGSLTECSIDLGSCGSDLATAEGGLATCNGSLGICNGSLSTCNSNLSSTNADLGDCDSELSATNADLASCNDNLSTANTDLETCAASLMAALACGNGLLDAGEDCDLGEPGIGGCVGEGFAGGVVSCGAGCQYDTTGCTNIIGYVDNADGTITDTRTGLMWEKKSGDSGIHNLNNRYVWSYSGTVPPPPTGEVFTIFLQTLNTSSFAGHGDWRLPTQQELLGIVDMSAIGCGAGGACIDPAFGPTTANVYWSSTMGGNGPMVVAFHDGGTAPFPAASDFYVRAVRSGS